MSTKTQHTPAEDPVPSDQDIRPAGPENMVNPPKQWKQEDQTSDESFPASDPPGTY